MTENTKIITQLRTLNMLTRAEAQIAQVRVAQARTDAVRRELTQNGRNAGERAEAITKALRDVGGIPDVVGPVVGRLAALVKSTAEQGQPLDEALLGDLSLEHQLLDRARYLKALAQAADNKSVGRLADRLITAHEATVEWLTVVLAEDALGGPAALRATPLQRVAGGAVRVANTPARAPARLVDRTVDTVAHRGEQARAKITTVSGKAARIGDDVRDTLSSGRDDTLRHAEERADQDGARKTAGAVHEVRGRLGALTVDELPLDDYDELNGADAIKGARTLTDATDLRALIAYEEAHKARSTVISAMQTHVADVAKDAAGIST